MKFIEKNASYHRLKNPRAVNADRDLLKEKNPQAPVLQRKFFDVDRQANEILYALLDVASVEEIVKNRIDKKVESKQKKGSPAKRKPAKRKLAKRKPAEGKPAEGAKDKGSQVNKSGDGKDDHIPDEGEAGKKNTEKNPNTQA